MRAEADRLEGMRPRASRPARIAAGRCKRNIVVRTPPMHLPTSGTCASRRFRDLVPLRARVAFNSPEYTAVADYALPPARCEAPAGGAAGARPPGPLPPPWGPARLRRRRRSWRRRRQRPRRRRRPSSPSPHRWRGARRSQRHWRRGGGHPARRIRLSPVTSGPHG